MTTKSNVSPKIALPILNDSRNHPPDGGQRRGRGRMRAFVLILVHLIIALHIVHYMIAGRSVSPIEPSEAMYTIELGQINAGAIFFGLAIFATAIFGRFFCGWGCHLIALQDLSSYLLRRFRIRPKPLRSRLLVVVPFVLAFYMFFWPTLKRLWYGIAHPGFTNHLMTQNFWYTFPGPAVTILTFVVCGGLIVYLLGNKGFCTYACPYGAFFSVADRVAPGRIYVTDACHQCGQCTAHCTSNVQVHAEVRDFGMVVDPGCMKCMDCVSVCPNDALYFGLKRRPDSKDKVHSLPILSPPKKSKKQFDYRLREELLGLAIVGFTVFALRTLYDIIPLLLSVALGVITAFLTLQLWRGFQRRDHRIQRIQLKRNRQFTKIGRITVVLILAWFAFLMHSFWVQYHRYQGRQTLNRVTVGWDDLFTGAAQAQLTSADHSLIDKAIRHFHVSDQSGMLSVKEVKLGLAIGYTLKDQPATAETYFRQAYQVDPPSVQEIIQLFLVSQGRWEEAAEFD